MQFFAATIGFFDGVHLGHQYLLSELRQIADSSGLSTAVITFDCHPLSILKNEHKPLLTTTDERMQLLKKQHLDEIFYFNFSIIKDFTAAEFLSILHEQCSVRILLMGYDHRFGSDRLVSHSDYEQAAAVAGIKLVWIDKYTTPQQQISSTHIRSLLMHGLVDVANQLLGYQYAITGEVVHGNQIGRQLGFPTANISVQTGKLVPQDGVYAVEVLIDSKSENLSNNYQSYKGVLNIGLKPTIAADTRTLEVHILDYTGNLYGQTLTILFCRFLRPEQKFGSLQQLQAQIVKDLQAL